jgi:hypothetical protein
MAAKLSSPRAGPGKLKKFSPMPPPRARKAASAVLTRGILLPPLHLQGEKDGCFEKSEDLSSPTPRGEAREGAIDRGPEVADG